MEQKRFLLALLLSAAILFGWSYLVPPTVPEQPAPVADQPQETATSAPTPTLLPTATPGAQNQTPVEGQAISQDETPRRMLTVSTPLYEVRFDTQGAVAVSWIIKKNQNNGRPVYSAGGSRTEELPLELISPVGVERGEAPLRLVTGDAGLDALLNSRNYTINVAEGEQRLELQPGESRELTFVMREPATNLEVTKRLTLYADHYSATLNTQVARGGQPISPVRLAIGPSIGDQGVPHYTFYSVAPEAIAFVGEDVERHYSSSIQADQSGQGHLAINGPAQWAGVGDTYFAMIAVPPAATSGLEYRTTRYEHQAAGQREERHLITGFVPIPADGSPTFLYVGPKDHDILVAANETISNLGGPRVDVEGLIDYGWFAWMSRPFAVPILSAIRFFFHLTGSYGVAIIIFTIIIYSLFFPLKWRSSKAMRKAQKLAPRMKELQEKIKGMKQNDPRLKELQMEQLRLMKEGNPLGGCLPLLIQMPFLFALYRAITISIDFRQASFLWMPDLSGADPWHLLPILMAGSMVVLQYITPAPAADPLQRRMMAVLLPAMMLYFMWSAPAGLLVYWLVGNIVGFSQQFFINRMLQAREDDAEPPPAEQKSDARGKKKPGGGARVSPAQSS